MSETKEPQCVNHCGHDPSWMKYDEEVETIRCSYPYDHPNVYAPCGHRCEFAPETQPEGAPFPERECPACEDGEATITPPFSSVVGSIPVHRPSGMVCMKHISQFIYDTLKKVGKA